MFWLIVTVVVLGFVILIASRYGDRIYDGVHNVIKEFTESEEVKEVKPEEIKSEEIKPEEIKPEEIKPEETK